MRLVHLRNHWHHHLSAGGTLAAVALTLTGFASGVAVGRHTGRGGVLPSTPPPRVSVIRANGGALPAAWYLGAYVVRVHDQGESNSCVGQTLAAMEEITQREHGRGAISFSSGFIYDQIDGGVDQGASYQDAFRVLTEQGDAPLSDFPHDGVDFWFLPTAAARTAASPYRFADWRSIAPKDRYTMEYELRHGRPLAVVLPWHDGLYDRWGRGGLVSADYGAFHFWHSTAVIGYNPRGLRILNSWGPAYGHAGRVTVSWGIIAAEAGEVVASDPIVPASAPRRGGRRPSMGSRA